MPSAKVEDQPDLTIPEQTLIRARLSEVKEKRIEWVDKATKEEKSATLWEWWFEVTDETVGGGMYKGRKLKGETDSKLTNHASNRARSWSEALLGRELPVGAGIDTDEDLVGLSCVLSVKHRPYTTKNGEPRTAEDIDELLPADGMDDVPFDAR
jgi:hypothetical protein